MNGEKILESDFESLRPHLRGVAFRMLGSLSDAEDAVQESWLRARRADLTDVANFAGYMTRVVARICLDTLRARRMHREGSLDGSAEVPVPMRSRADPAEEAELVDSIGVALMVVLNRLAPAERIAFVLHDLFGVPFDDIASILEKSPEATRQLASRGRRRVQGADQPESVDLDQQRAAVEAYIAASRNGDFAALMAVLDPNVEGRSELTGTLRGAAVIAQNAMRYRAKLARVCLIDGRVGFIVAPRGKLKLAVLVHTSRSKIVHMEVVADPARLNALDIALPPAGKNDPNA